MTTQQSSTNNNSSLLDGIKNIIAVLGSTAAIAVAFLWYVGRRYREGYFSALNIPYSYINLSIWDYGETSWFTILLAFLFLSVFIYISIIRIATIRSIRKALYLIPKHIRHITALVVIAVVIILEYYIENVVIEAIFNILFMLFIFIIPLGDKPSSADRSDRYIAYFQSTYAFIYIITVITAQSINTGQKDGLRFVTTTASHVMVMLNNPLLKNVSHTEDKLSDDSILYTYDNLYFLTFNDKRYFLFKDIGPDCKPVQVYVLKEEDVRSIEYQAAPPLRPNCVPVTPTTIPTSSPPPAPSSVPTLTP